MILVLDDWYPEFHLVVWGRHISFEINFKVWGSWVAIASFWEKDLQDIFPSMVDAGWYSPFDWYDSILSYWDVFDW